MKSLIILVFCFLAIVVKAQTNLFGHYKDKFGSQVTINSDSTFLYTWNFDLSSSWTKGTWMIYKDTLFFSMTPVYDTIKYFDKKINLTKDSLVISDNEKSEVITTQNDLIASLLLSGGQNRRGYPAKLYWKKERLYGFEDGKILKRKIKGFRTNKMFVPWYYKTNNN